MITYKSLASVTVIMCTIIYLLNSRRRMIMKKFTKLILLGSGAAFVGFVAYLFLHEPTSEEKDIIKDKKCTTPHTVTINKEYIERRRKHLMEKKKKAISGEDNTPVLEFDGTNEITDNSVESSNNEEMEESSQMNNTRITENKSIDEGGNSD